MRNKSYVDSLTFYFGFTSEFIVVDEGGILQTLFDDGTDLFDGHGSHNVLHQNLREKAFRVARLCRISCYYYNQVHSPVP